MFQSALAILKTLQAPKFEFISNARPSLFAYPAPTKPPTKEAVEKVATAVLSTTAKAKARERTKEKEKREAEGDSMETVSYLPRNAARVTDLSQG